MTVKQVREKLSAYPDDMEVFFTESYTGFKFVPVETISQETINFMEDPGGKALAQDKVVVIDTF